MALFTHDRTLTAGESVSSPWASVASGAALSMVWYGQFSTQVSVDQSPFKDGHVLTYSIFSTVTDAGMTSQKVLFPTMNYVRFNCKNQNPTATSYVSIFASTLSSRSASLGDSLQTSNDRFAAQNYTAVGAFGEPISTRISPIVQQNFAFGTIGTVMRETVCAGGSIAYADNAVYVTCPSTINTRVTIKSRTPVTYHPGRGIHSKFTFRAVNTESGYIAMAGFVGPPSLFAVGVSSSTFSLIYSNESERPIYAMSMTAGAAGVATLTLDGTSTVVTFPAGYTDATRTAMYVSQLDLTGIGLGWRQQLSGTAVVFLGEDPYRPTGIFTLSRAADTTIQATFSVITSGTTLSANTAIPYTAFNIDTLDGRGPSRMSLSVHNFNVFRLEYQYLGAGNMNAMVENPNTGTFFPFHMFKRANGNTIANFYSPHMRVGYAVRNYSNMTNPMTISGLCMAAFIEGDDIRYTGKNSVVRTMAFANAGDTSITNTFTNVIAISPLLWAGSKTLFPIVHLHSLNFHTVGGAGKILTIALSRRGTLSIQGGAAIWATASSDSLVLFNTVSTTFTSFTPSVQYRVIMDGTPQFIDLLPFSITVAPGDQFFLAAQSSAVGTTLTTALMWQEDF